MNSQLQYQVNFNVDTISIDITPPGGYLAANVFFEIIDPSGAVIKEADLDATADYIFTDDTPGTWNAGIEIATNTGGKPLKGNYIVNAYVTGEDTGGGPSDETLEDALTYYYCPVDSFLNLSVKVDCFKGQISVADMTDLTSYDVSDYLLEIVAPTITGYTIPGASTSLKSIKLLFPYTNVTYQAQATASLSKTTVVDSQWTVVETFSYLNYQPVKVDCNSTCDLTECAAEELDRLGGGDCAKVMNASDTAKFLRITKNLALLAAKQNCGNCEDTADIVAALKADVDCSCGDTTNPVRFKSVCGDYPTETTIQTIDGEGDLERGARVIYWNVDDGEADPDLNMVIGNMEVNRPYLVVITGTSTDLRYFRSSDTNVAGNTYPTLQNFYAFSVSGSGVYLKTIVSDGTTIFIQTA